MQKTIKVYDLIKKRKELWEKSHDENLDKELTSAIADKLLSVDSLREEISKKPYLLIECCFTVVDKEKRNVPFFLNTVQKDFISKIETLGRQKPYFILKGRQQGFTTVITAIQLSYAIVKRNFAGFTVADREDNTKAIFTDKAKVMYNSLPQKLKPSEKFNSTSELYFDKLNSSWRIACATGNVGRSRTLSFIHYSEVAFFKCQLSDIQKSIAEAATRDALCIYETTANGFNQAKELWDSNSCHNLFYEWWKTEEYTSYEYEYLETNDSWLKNRLESLRKRGLSREQLTWYAKKYSSYIDKSSIRQEYPCSPEEAFVTSGDSIFDSEAISNYLSVFDVTYTLGFFEYEKRFLPIYGEGEKILGYKKEIYNISFKESLGGYIRLVEEPYIKELEGKTVKSPYVIGADTAGSGNDYFTAKVIDNSNGKCVATLRKQRIDEDLFAEQLYCLGKYYNDAHIAVEINYSRHPVNVLKELDYPNLYHQGIFEHCAPSTATQYGFLTTSANRPVIISNLVSVMRECLKLETDRDTLKEMLTFVRRTDGKCAGADGSHDDLVMASAICRYVSIFQPHEKEIIDTGSDFLLYNDSFHSLQENDFMEW